MAGYPLLREFDEISSEANYLLNEENYLSLLEFK